MLNKHEIMLERVALCRMEIDAARLVVLDAAIKIDEGDAKSAKKEIAVAKVVVPNMLLKVIDRAIQAYGGAGVSQDTPLANMYAHGRTMRIVDGPDEVHTVQLGKAENKRGQAVLKKHEMQKRKNLELLKQYGLQKKDVLVWNAKSHL